MLVFGCAMVKIKHPAVFVVGAGATRGAYDDLDEENKPKIFPPLDADFFEIASKIRTRGTGKNADKVLKDVHHLYGKVYGIGLETYYREIETRGDIVKFAKSQNKPKDWDSRKENLDELIRRVLIQTTCKSSGGTKVYSPRESNLLKKMLGTVESGDNIVSFNYDTLLEESMAKETNWNPRDGYGVRVSGVRGSWCKNWFIKHKQRNAGFKILKMHGSLNWKGKSGDRIILKDRPYVVRQNRSGNPAREAVLFLPPSYLKAVNKYPYNAIWKQARSSIEHADALVILGYSLPQNDFLVRAFFSEIIRHRHASNRMIRQIVIINPDGGVRENFLELLKPAMNSTTKIHLFGTLKEFSESL